MSTLSVDHLLTFIQLQNYYQHSNIFYPQSYFFLNGRETTKKHTHLQWLHVDSIDTFNYSCY